MCCLSWFSGRGCCSCPGLHICLGLRLDFRTLFARFREGLAIWQKLSKNVRKLCFQPLWTIFFSDIFRHFSDILSTFPWVFQRFARYKTAGGQQKASPWPKEAFQGFCGGCQRGSAAVCNPNHPRPFARYRTKHFPGFANSGLWGVAGLQFKKTKNEARECQRRVQNVSIPQGDVNHTAHSPPKGPKPEKIVSKGGSPKMMFCTPPPTRARRFAPSMAFSREGLCEQRFSACAPPCCKNLCCASRFCTGCRGAVGSRSKQMSKGP